MSGDAEIVFRQRLERLVSTVGPDLRLAECAPTIFDSYTVRLEHAGTQGSPIAVPLSLLRGMLREDPVALRMLRGVLSWHAESLLQSRSA
jgi:hypothetical protein